MAYFLQKTEQIFKRKFNLITEQILHLDFIEIRVFDLTGIAVCSPDELRSAGSFGI